MRASLPQTHSNIDQEHLNLLLGPAAAPGKISHTKSLQAVHEVLLHPHALFLLLAVLRPRVDRPRIALFVHVHEAGGFHLGLEGICGGQVDAELGRVGDHVARPLHRRRRLVDGAVIAAEWEV